MFEMGNYLPNFIQSLFYTIGEPLKGCVLVLGGDGRYFNKEAVRVIMKMAAANGVGKLMIGKEGLMSTPAMSAVIRKHKALGGIIMTASHNPGGPKADWGIKFNTENGGPAPESFTNELYKATIKIEEYKIAAEMDFPDIDLGKCDLHKIGKFEVEVIDPVKDYLDLLQSVFHFDSIKALLTSPRFSMIFDGMHGVAGPYAKRILVQELGAMPSSCVNCVPLEDFGGGHPDPNLTYAKDLVDKMYAAEGAPDFGAACDGDADRNMILGRKCFVSPSDAVAVVAANSACIPYFKEGLKGVARSMPTSGALDRVGKKMGIDTFETPTGWKFFGTLMDAGKLSICGEESFGCGADHVREKDGLFSVLAWLQILADKNKEVAEDQPLIGISDIMMQHWQAYGRNFFTRYDYEEVPEDAAKKLMDHIMSLSRADPPLVGMKFEGFELTTIDEFEYVDPIDASVSANQGHRILFADGSRIVFRLSGTGSSGATVRMYIERYDDNAENYGKETEEALAPLVKVALELSKLETFLEREKPTVIT
jgi:phosphoglucomutase